MMPTLIVVFVGHGPLQFSNFASLSELTGIHATTTRWKPLTLSQQ